MAAGGLSRNRAPRRYGMPCHASDIHLHEASVSDKGYRSSTLFYNRQSSNAEIVHLTYPAREKKKPARHKNKSFRSWGYMARWRANSLKSPKTGRLTEFRIPVFFSMEQRTYWFAVNMELILSFFQADVSRIFPKSFVVSKSVSHEEGWIRAM